MKLRSPVLLVLLLPLGLWQCATPPPAGPRPQTAPAPVPASDEGRLVSREEFLASPWKDLSPAARWKAHDTGVVLSLADGREAQLAFVAPGVVRWQVSAGPGAVSAGSVARYPAAPDLLVKVTEAGGILFVDGPGLGVRLRLADLSWALVRGDKTVLRTAGGPRVAGRRLNQGFEPADAALWSGPGLEAPDRWTRYAADGPFTVPALFGAGGNLPFAILLDNSLQTYGRITDTEVTLGSLDGGLDLLVSAAPQPAAALGALSALTGRPEVPPVWAHDTALTLPAGGAGAFLRAAKLPIEAVARKAAQAPGQRPLALAATGNLAQVRQVLPEIRVTPADEGALSRVLNLGLAGFGLPAVRLDLTGLADRASRPQAFRMLNAWLLVSVLTLDWGPDPAGLWAALPDADRRTLKTLLDRRSSFKPLFAQAARQAALTGRPAWTPLWVDWPAEPGALTAGDEFLVADTFLAAPADTGTSRPVYLPGPGVWFDFWTGEEYGGGRTYDVATRVDRPLLFARGGTFIPVREPETFAEKDVYNPLTVHVFPGGRGSGTYWTDDGLTTAWKAGIAVETRLTFDYAQKDMTLDHEAVSAPTQVRADPYLLYRIHNVFKPRQVRIAGKAIPLFGDSWGITDTDRSAAWYENDHTLLIKTFRPDRDQTIQISF